MSADPFLCTTLAARSVRIEAERVVLAFFICAQSATPSQIDASAAADLDGPISFSIQQICAGTGLDHSSVIEACATLADGWARDNLPPGRAPRLVPVLSPVLAPIDDSDDWDIHYALNVASSDPQNDDGREVR